MGKRSVSGSSSGSVSVVTSAHSSCAHAHDIQLVEPDDSESDDATEAPVSGVGKASRPTPKNSDLPTGAMDNNDWKRLFLPTFLRNLGTRSNCWNIPDSTLISLLQSIWDTVYGVRVPHTIEAGDIVIALVCDQLTPLIF